MTQRRGITSQKTGILVLSPVTESTTYICGHRRLCYQTNGGTAHNAQLLLPLQHTSIVHKYIHNYMLHGLCSGRGGGKQPTRITENRSCKLSTANLQLKLETQSFLCCAQSHYNLGAGGGKAPCVVNRRTKWVFTFTFSQLYP